jgi:predicted HTH transcriptional regulator
MVRTYTAMPREKAQVATTVGNGLDQSKATGGLAAGKLVNQGEGVETEFKSTLRVNLHTGQSDARIEQDILKSLAAFMNSHGGTLIIGVNDQGKPLGLKEDNFPNEDKMNLHLVNLIRDRIGPQHMLFIRPRFEDYENARVLVVECKRSPTPVYVKDGNMEHFFTRTGAATTELTGNQMQQFIRHRFR